MMDGLNVRLSAREIRKVEGVMECLILLSRERHQLPVFFVALSLH